MSADRWVYDKFTAKWSNLFASPDHHMLAPVFTLPVIDMQILGLLTLISGSFHMADILDICAFGGWGEMFRKNWRSFKTIFFYAWIFFLFFCDKMPQIIKQTHYLKSFVELLWQNHHTWGSRTCQSVEELELCGTCWTEWIKLIYCQSHSLRHRPTDHSSLMSCNYEIRLGKTREELQGPWQNKVQAYIFSAFSMCLQA